MFPCSPNVGQEEKLPQAFIDVLASGGFLVTTEETPPKGADLTGFTERAAKLVGQVDAVNVTDSSAAVMTMSPLGAVPCLIDFGLEPVLQLSCRDRNRIALQGDLLAAAALGVSTIVCTSGDPMDGGDHPEARTVADLDTVELLWAAEGLNRGHDLAGKPLRSSTAFCCGAFVNPGAVDLDRELAWMERKAEAGARFFQTQAVYDPGRFEKFMNRAGRLNVPILAGFIVLKSGAMARRMNRSLPGVSIPDSLIRELDAAEDKPALSIEISGRVLRQLATSCRGVHLIAVGWESHLSAILDAAGISRVES
jgi:5,10-methylenetetrahydrofolate reductase